MYKTQINTTLKGISKSIQPTKETNQMTLGKSFAMKKEKEEMQNSLKGKTQEEQNKKMKEFFKKYRHGI